MKSDLEKLYEENLVCPESRDGLAIANQTIITSSGKTYRFDNNIPCFLSSSILTEHQKSELESSKLYIQGIKNNTNPLYSPEMPFVHPKDNWGWSEEWLNSKTVHSDTKIVCICGAFGDDLPHVHSDYKFNIDHLANEYCKLLPEMLKANTHHIACTSENMPFRDNYADFVYTRNGLDHVCNPIQTMKEIYRILKPGRKLLIGVYFNSTFINACESSVIDNEFIDRCIKPMFEIEHRTIHDTPQQEVFGGEKTGFIYLVCRKLTPSNLSFTQEQIQAAGSILSNFHSALYYEAHRQYEIARDRYSRLLKIQPVFTTDVWRMIYSLIRFLGMTAPEKHNDLKKIIVNLLGHDSFWEEILDKTTQDYAITISNDFIEDDPANYIKILDVPNIIEGWRVLWYLARAAHKIGLISVAERLAAAIINHAPDFIDARLFLKKLDSPAAAGCDRFSEVFGSAGSEPKYEESRISIDKLKPQTAREICTKLLPAQTAQEAELVEGLRKSFAALPKIERRDAFPSEAKWTSHMNRLRELVLNDDPRRFLCWDVIKGTMFVGYDSYVETELDYLKTLPDWDTRWREAINESSIGHPLPYPSYPSSSGNLITHAYHLAQFEEKTKTRVNEMDYIFEFGGGYGSMCRLFHNLCFHGKYVIFDLPYFSELQRFYLRLLGIRIHTIDTFAETNKGVICISDFERLKAILLREFKECNTMFVATWSISETPINLRNLVLPLVADCEAFLIGYQHQFEEVNNLEFFSKWRESLNGDITWHNWQIGHIPGNSYLMGKQSDRLLKADKIRGKEREKLDEIVSLACQGQTQRTGSEQTPTVSIYMAVRNGEKYLSDTIESILNQTYGDFELVIVDDGSSDGTVDVAKSYQSRDARVKVISLPHKGVVGARNKAIEHTNPHSRYLLNHDGDDISLQGKLEKLVRYLDEHPQVAIVGCFAEYFDDEGNNRGQPPVEWQVERIRQTFGRVNSMVHSASLMRRQVLVKLGGYREDYLPVEDYDFFARALLAGFNLANIPEVLHKIRLHPASIGSVLAEPVKVAADGVRQYYIAQQQKQAAQPIAERGLPKRTCGSDDSLKILHTAEFYHPHIGGAEIVVQQLSERLARRGHKVTVATTKLPERKVREVNGVGIEEFDISGSLVRGTLGSDIARYREFLLKYPADVMMNYAAQQWATDLAFETLDLTGGRRVNIIVPCGYSALEDACTLRLVKYKDYFTRIIPTYLPKYDAAIYHSANYQDYQFAQNCNLTNSVVIPNGVCEQEFSQASKVDFRRKYNITTKYFGICVANFYPGKGQERVIECVRQMNRPDFTMVFIGTEGGQLARIRQLASGLNVKFCTGIDRQDVLAAYHQADIFLFGSEKECSPLVILEAKASRLPFVSTDCGNVRDWSGGVVCAPEKMAAYANRILDNDEIRKVLALEGFRQWKEDFTWESVVDRYEKLYRLLHREKTGSGVGRKRLVSYAGGPKRQNQAETGITALIFSKDRAMQLQATIESFILQCRDNDAADIVVLFKASGAVHQKQYDELKKNFPAVTFIEETDFRQQVLSVVERCKYVLFLVDDNIFVKPFSLKDIIAALGSERKAVGFSLRLGKNTHYCYMLSSPQKLPSFECVREGVLKYYWPGAERDFGYPLEVSSSVYRSNEILHLLNQVEFSNPNTLEGMMSRSWNAFASAVPFLLTFEESVTFCNPVNVVQHVYENNKFGTIHNYTPEQLTEYFFRGMAVDVQKYAGLTPNSAHQEVELYFKPADRVISEAQAARTGCEHQVKTSKPKFSIVMANYNNGRYISQAIESVLNQTFTDWELIIIEDGSTDNSPNIIEKHLDDVRIRLLRHGENRGYTAALKTGIANVRSEYFGILDSDDCLLPHAVETMHAYHIKFPGCGLIYSQFAYCNEDLTRRCMGFCDKIPTGKTALDVNVVSHFKTFKLNDYLKTSGYDENILYAEDVDIVYKMEEVAGLKFVDECLYLYRELPASICHSRSRINVAIMSRAKARINALKRRCVVLAESGSKNFEDLFAQAIKQARESHKDVEQYFVLLAKLYENNLLLSDSSLPVDVKSRDDENKLLWLAAKVNIKFDKLFELLASQRQAVRQPLVTVYMVTYNAQKFIAKAIDSVLSQVYKNFELLIVDDGSTDETSGIIAPYSDPRIRYIYKEHKNCASGRNRAIAEAKGKYVMVVDSDDFIAPDYIEKMVAFAEKHPQVDYFYPAQLTLVNESGDPTGQQWNYMDFSDNTILPAFLFRNCYGPIPNPGSLKRKTLFDKVGLYDEVDTVEDFVFLCKNALKINFKRVDEHSMYFYRKHRQNTSMKFEIRNRIMADVLNEMVSIYPDEVLYPQIADISDAALRERRYYEYVVETFCRHSNGPMVQFGHYFQKYAAHYRSKLLGIAGQKQLVPK